MTDDLNIWLDGAPVIPTPGGENFDIWLQGAPVVAIGGSDSSVSISGSEVVTETGTVTATGDGFATVTGSEALTETGTVTAGEIVTVAITGEECLTETGTVTVTVDEPINGSEVATETGTVIVRVINPVPPPGGSGGSHRIHTRWSYAEPKKAKKRPYKYQRAEKPDIFDILEVVLEPDKPLVIEQAPKITVVRLQGSEVSSSTGLFNTLIDHPEDPMIIEMVLRMLEEEDKRRDQEELEAVLGAVE